MDLKAAAKKLKQDIPAVFIALKKEETPLAAKLVAALTVGYALSPIDLVPDFIPVLGYLDDLLVLPGLVALTLRLIPPEVLSQCRKEAESLWQDGRPRRWWYAVPIVLFWVAVVWLVAAKLLRVHCEIHRAVMRRKLRVTAKGSR